MICTHCGFEYDDSYNYCPKCAEPKTVMKPGLTFSEEREEFFKKKKRRYLIHFIVHFICSIFYCICFMMIGGLPGYIIGFLLVNAAALMPYLIAVAAEKDKRTDEREVNIRIQYEKDDTSICPHCGSHDIALGRKGYDWSKGFWYNLFGTPGAGYVAGMDSRRVTCYCQHCGHKWLSKQEWIK